MGGAFTGQLLAKHPDASSRLCSAGRGSPKPIRSCARRQPRWTNPCLRRGAEAAAFQRLKRSLPRQGYSAAPGAPLQIDLAKVKIPVMAINGEFDSPHAKTERMARELKSFQNVILPGKNHMSAIAVGGPMPPQYIDSLVAFVNSHDSKK
jgi:pimeloyl-ACP methyl ester carboxylesterase